jgi:phosphomannomutase
MYGAGQRAVPLLLPNAVLLHCEDNPGFKGQAPEPIPRNLKELAALVGGDPGIDMGLANDCDADRIGMYDGEGRFVDSHHIILLLIHYLHQYKGLTGKVVVAFSVSDKVKKLCAAYGLEIEVTKIGFKYICGKMVTDDVLLGGEESGGIAVKGHVPERDGIWCGLLLLEFMAVTGKSLRELIEEVYAVVGAFSFDRNDLHLDEAVKQRIVANCESGSYKAFGPYTIQRTETIDGYKYHLDENRWVMIRPSGTEPVLRVYAEAPDQAEVGKLLEATKATLLA